MSLFVYEPGKMQIGFGIPNIDLSALGLPEVPTFVSMKDWVSLTSQKSAASFSMRRGVWGETILDYVSDTSRIFSLSILQTSDNVIALRGLLLLQKFGIVGMPFSITDTSGPGDSNGILPNLVVNDLRQKSVYPVGVIMDEPNETWTLDGAAWVFQIAVAYGKTAYV